MKYNKCNPSLNHKTYAYIIHLYSSGLVASFKGHFILQNSYEFVLETKCFVVLLGHKVRRSLLASGWCLDAGVSAPFI